MLEWRVLLPLNRQVTGGSHDLSGTGESFLIEQPFSDVQARVKGERIRSDHLSVD